MNTYTNTTIHLFITYDGDDPINSKIKYYCFRNIIFLNLISLFVAKILEFFYLYMGVYANESIYKSQNNHSFRKRISQ